MRTLEQQQDPWQPPTPAGFEQGVPWRSPCEHSNSSRIRAHATQNAVRQNAFRYLRNPYKTKTSLLAGTLGRLQHQQASKECHGGAHAKHSNSSRLRAHAQQNAVQQNAPRYKTRMQAHRRQKLWISSRILCNNFLGALPLTPNEGSADSH